MRIIWSPFSGMQTEALAADEFEVFLGGSKGPGKSDLLLWAVQRQTHEARYKALITRETGPQLAELKRRSHQYYPQLPEKPHWIGEGHGRWIWPTGAEVVFESIGTPDDAKKVQGHEYAVVAQDEVANIPEERTVDLVQSEIRCPNPNVIKMWRGSGNPGKAGHAWVKRRFVVPCGRDGRRVIVRRVQTPAGVADLTRRFIPGTVLDNPIYANDPLYLAQLLTLPEVLRRQLLYGDWDAGSGTALDELDEAVHLIYPFEVPDLWSRFGSFDYGYAHWWVWIVYGVDEDGIIYVIDTIRGRRHKPHEIADRVNSSIGHVIRHPQYGITVSDTYVFRSKKELSDTTPTIGDILRDDHQLVLSHGPTDRKAGLLNLRYYLAWRGINPDGSNGEPGLYFMDTPGNRWLITQCQGMVVDESDPEDVLKVNADPETGEGGDDGYDALRVGIASRPPRAIGEFLSRGNVSAFSRQVLTHMVEHLYKDRELPGGTGARTTSTLFTGV